MWQGAACMRTLWHGSSAGSPVAVCLTSDWGQLGFQAGDRRQISTGLGQTLRLRPRRTWASCCPALRPRRRACCWRGAPQGRGAGPAPRPAAPRPRRCHPAPPPTPTRPLPLPSPPLCSRQAPCSFLAGWEPAQRAPILRACEYPKPQTRRDFRLSNHQHRRRTKRCSEARPSWQIATQFTPSTDAARRGQAAQIREQSYLVHHQRQEVVVSDFTGKCMKNLPTVQCVVPIKETHRLPFWRAAKLTACSTRSCGGTPGLRSLWGGPALEQVLDSNVQRGRDLHRCTANCIPCVPPLRAPAHSVVCKMR